MTADRARATRAQVPADVRRAFKAYDVDDSDSISQRELGDALRKYGLDYTTAKTECAELFKEWGLKI